MYLAAACVLAWLAAAAPARAQAPENHGPLRVFLDCGRCDFDYVRREIPFVDYVRDPKEAEVHILVTTQPTASGGTEFLFQFIGLGRFSGVDDETRYTASQLESYDEQRQGYTRIIKAGIPVVSAPQQPEALDVIEHTCAEHRSPLVLVGREWLYAPGRIEQDGQWFARVRRCFHERFTPTQSVIWTGDMNVAPEPIDVYHPDRRVNDVDFHIDARNAYKLFPVLSERKSQVAIGDREVVYHGAGTITETIGERLRQDRAEFESAESSPQDYHAQCHCLSPWVNLL